MELTVGTQLDAGPLDAGARPDAVAVSPGGLLSILETHLGLASPRASLTDRIVALIPTLHATEGYWSRSLRADAWGTAQRLLRDLDALSLEGWFGQPVSERWDALWAVTRHLDPGQGERWHAVALALDTPRSLPIERIRLIDPLHTFPGAVARTLRRLQTLGIPIDAWAPPPMDDFRPQATDDADLRQALAPSFEPRGDGSLQLVRPPGPVQAADDLAAWLSTWVRPPDPSAPIDQPMDADTVAIIGADATLDEALRRYGLPGAQVSGATDALALLPLALGFEPAVPDPSAALELLLAQPNPIPAALRHRLARALRRTPAVGNPKWQEALEQWRDEASGEQAERVQTLLTPGPSSPDGPWSAADLQARGRALAQWARARAHADDQPDPALGCVAAQCQRFVDLLDIAPEDTVTAAWAERLVRAATDDAGQPRSAAQAGIQFVSRPGAIVGRPGLVVWWNFTRDTAALPRPLALCNAERDALRAHGVQVRSAQDRAQAEAALWWHPLRVAQARALFIAPQTQSPGERLHPHPLWSELLAKIPAQQRDAAAARLEAGAAGSPELEDTEPLGAPLPVSTWQIEPGSIAPREQESPSSLGALVGCPLQYVLKYRAKVSKRAAFALDVSPRDIGALAHHVLAEVLRDDPRDPERAHADAAARFDACGPTLASALFQPGQSSERDKARGQVAQSVRALVRWLVEHDLHVIGTETDVTRDLGAFTLGGRVDLLAGNDDTAVVLDHKLGGRKGRHEELEHGTAAQLAAYAFALRTDDRPPPGIGYFIVRDQTLLGVASPAFPHESAVDGPAPAETWAAFYDAAQTRWAELQAGSVQATGVGVGKLPKTALEGEVYREEPPCKYCDYSLLCGRDREAHA